MDYKAAINQLNEWTKLYDMGTPAVTDKEWDDLYFKVKKYEEQNHITNKFSPIDSIQYDIVNSLKKVQHNHLMLSLDKTKNIDDIKTWAGRKEIIAMCKMDGLTCSLLYQDGKLVRAETRGNGIIGEDVTHNAKIINNIPHYINLTDEVIIDGEIICKYDDFVPFQNDYKNPRNFASGSIRLLDSKECSRRHLSFIAWDGIKGFSEINNLSDRLNKIYNLGFEIVPNILVDDYKDAVEKLKQSAKEASYPIDGIVFKYNIDKDYVEAGKTDHHFKGGFAYKFYDETYETHLKRIDWSMGRRGSLTPVAEFDPVDIDGSVVERASLHNIDIMHQTLHGNGFLGQTVYIAKMNQIIPQIQEAEEPSNTTVQFDIPTVCPECGGHLEIKNDNNTKMLYCVNPNCNGKLINKLDHFAGKKGLDIKGISKATLEKLIDWGWIKSQRDIFTLEKHKQEWIKKSGFGEKSVSNILKSIEKNKHTELWRIIAAADIPNIGTTASKAIAEYFKTWSNFMNAIVSGFDFTSLPDFGEIANHDLHCFDYTEINFIVTNYLSYDENINMNEKSSLSDIANGKNFVITGKLIHFKNRSVMQSAIESIGGRVTGSVTSKTDYLINNDINSTTAKNVTAKKLGIPIITENELIDMFPSIENFENF